MIEKINIENIDNSGELLLICAAKINGLIDFNRKLYEIISTQNNQIARLEQEVRELGGFKSIEDK